MPTSFSKQGGRNNRIHIDQWELWRQEFTKYTYKRRIHKGAAFFILMKAFDKLYLFSFYHGSDLGFLLSATSTHTSGKINP